MDCLNFPFTPTRISLQSVAATLCNLRFMKSCQTLNFLVYITLTATFVLVVVVYKLILKLRIVVV